MLLDILYYIWATHRSQPKISEKWKIIAHIFWLLSFFSSEFICVQHDHTHYIMLVYDYRPWSQKMGEMPLHRKRQILYLWGVAVSHLPVFEWGFHVAAIATHWSTRNTLCNSLYLLSVCECRMLNWYRVLDPFTAAMESSYISYTEFCCIYGRYRVQTIV